MKCAVIISGGQIQPGFALSFLKKHPAKYLIGADAGILFCRKYGVQPTHIVGDFDSAGEDAVAYFAANESISVQRFCPQKDFTDTEIALRLALSLGAETIWILGGTGSRLDHVVANINSMFIALRAGAKAFLVDENNKMFLSDTPISLKKSEQHGRYVSLFAFGDAVRGLTLEGFAYPVSGYTLERGNAIGVSNEISEETGKIFLTEGVLLIVESKD